MKTTRKKKIEQTDTVDEVRRACGEVWTKLVTAFHYLNDEHDMWLSGDDADTLFARAGSRKWPLKGVGELWEKLPIEELADQFDDVDAQPEADQHDSNPFVTATMKQASTQQRQQVVRRFYDHVDTFFDELLPQWKENGRDPDEMPRLPYRKKRYSRADWVHTKIEKEKDTLILKGGVGVDDITVEWPHPEPRAVQIIHENGQPTICAQYDSEKQDLPDGLIRERLPQGEKVAGVDLGEVCIAAAHDGEDTIILDGERLRQLRCIQNREKRRFDEQIDRKEKGSNRFWKLVDAKRDRLKEIRDRIDDYLHKMSTRLVEELWSQGVEKIVYGDIGDIREDMNYGADMNRRLHQWAFGKFIDKVTYKAERYGMEVTSTREVYTSQTCPQCGTAKHSHKDGREFRCSTCDFEAHRDAVGAMNIRAKAQDPEEWSEGYLKAVRATATGGSTPPTGSPSGSKSPSNSEGATVSTRREKISHATHSVHFPRAISYEPHMDCVLEDP